METIIRGAGVFIYPLGLCSVFAMFIIIERLFALWPSRVMPKDLMDALMTGSIVNHPGDKNSAAGRIVFFFRVTNPDPEALKAFARLEIARLERGMFILEIVISGAPLLGLLGTIAGLSKVFSSEASAGAAGADIAGGISLALTTTMLGLCVAIPTLVFNSYLNRRVDLLSARLDMVVERLIDLARRK